MRPLTDCKALVVDMTHGGKVLCEELLKRDCEVYAFDNHKTLKKEELEKLIKNGIRVFSEEKELKVEDFDVIIVQHADPAMRLFSSALELGVPVISHARAVGIILSEIKSSKKIIEITGTNGKTTTANMILKILNDHGYSALIHDSLSTRVSMDSGDILLAEGLSITPANALRAFRLAEGLDFDYAIFEVSLGGTGAGDVGVVTGIYENYKASFFKNAFNSKLQMAINMKKGILVLNGDNITRKFAHAFFGNSNIYGIENGREVKIKKLGERVEGSIERLSTISGKKLNANFEFKLQESLFGRFQILNALGALTAVASLDLEVENACKSLEGFEGVKGRAIAEKMARGILVDCSNRGINVPAILTAIDDALILRGKKGDGIVAVLSGSEKATCEIIDTPKLSKELKKRDIDLIVLSGALGKRLVELGVKGEFVENLSKNEVEKLSARFNNPIILFFSNEA
ncbi:MAG: coenzyme F430 synthase [Archaeoglobaceae archaeon]|nr:coenzyme F430 synthase [Archaeoglobaceae archaeon]MDW8118441.1 coenzyme F430 synthase [Archaeoglobaceae archaeon]